MKELLVKAADEIERLRSYNQFLEAQVRVIDVFAAALGLRPEQRGMVVDVAWELRRAAEEIVESPKEK